MPEANHIKHKLKQTDFSKSKFSKKQLVVFALAFTLIGGYIVFRSFAAGNTFYVSTTGSDSNPGTSSQPFATIQRAVTAAANSSCDTVVVKDGTYTVSAGSTFATISKAGTSGCPLTFKSENKWGAKLNGQKASSVAFKLSSGAQYIRIEGFDIYGFAGGQITSPASLSGDASGIEAFAGGGDSTFINNKIHSIGENCTNTTNGLVGIFIEAPNITIENNYIYDIGRWQAGQNGCGTNYTTDRNHDHGIYVNGQAGGGSAGGSSGAIIKNNIFSNTYAGFAVQLYPGTLSNVKVVNNTFNACNDSKSYHCFITGATFSNIDIKNNIFNSPSGQAIERYNGTYPSSFVVANNITKGSAMWDSQPTGITMSSNQVNTDPKLVNPSGGDFSLQSTSPAIDAGVTIAEVTTDYNGTVRPQGSAHDIGAFEYGTVTSPPPPPPSAGSCTKTLNAGGSITTFVNGLVAGDVGCVHSGTYDIGNYTFQNSGASGNTITLTSYPGEKATINGNVMYIPAGKNFITIDNLNLSLTAGNGAPSIQVFGDDITLSNNNITNGHNAESAIAVGEYEGTFARVVNRVKIIGNKIHDSGKAANGTHDHGIYMAATQDGVITDNLIYDNEGGWGIQLWTHAMNTTITHNVIDGNTSGNIILAGDSNTVGGPSSNNNISQNILSNPDTQYNVSIFWANGNIGTGNTINNNCMYNAPGGNFESSTGYTQTGNITANPTYVDRANKDFRLQAGSPCLSKVGYDTAAKLVNSDTTSLGSALPSLLPASTGTQLFVSPAGSGTACSQASPCAMQTGINQSSAGSRIEALAGIYNVNINWSNKSGTASAPITLQNYNGADVTLRSSVNTKELFRIGDNSSFVRLKGIKIEASSNLWTGTGHPALYISGVTGAHDIDVIGTTIIGYDAGTSNGHDGTAFLTGPGATKINIIGNRCYGWGDGNTSTPGRHCFYMQQDSGLVANNLIHDIPYGNGIQIRGDSSSVKNCNTIFTNNTVVTRASGEWGIYVEANCNGVRIRNNVVAFAGAQELYGLFSSDDSVDPPASTNRAFTNLLWDTSGNKTGNTSGHQVLDFTDGSGNYTGPGTNTVADPQFASASDYHLKATSPAVGQADLAYAMPYDFDGNTRDSSPDLGAYEYTSLASKQGDLNNDGLVNIFDLSILLTDYGKTKANASNPACDINNDNTVNIFDLSILLSKYGT